MTAQAPVIDSIVATPAAPSGQLVEGGTATVVVTAHDANARVIHLSIPVATADASTTAELDVRVAAAVVTYGTPTVTDPEGVATITPGSTPGTYTLKV